MIEFLIISHFHTSFTEMTVPSMTRFSSFTINTDIIRTVHIEILRQVDIVSVFCIARVFAACNSEAEDGNKKKTDTWHC
jgi:hypothetical protein